MQRRQSDYIKEWINTTLTQIGSDHLNYLFPFSLYTAHTCYFILNPIFACKKREFKIPFPV